MGDHLQGFLEQLHSGPMSGERLEVLGKQAAADWCRGKYKTLSEAVISTVKQAHLVPEQVRRVVEFTNIAAFNSEFRKEASPHRVVNFFGGPADPSAILKEIDTRGAVVTRSSGLGDYQGPPPARTKVASQAAEAAFEQALSARAPADPVDNPFGAAVDTWQKLSSIRDQLTSELDGLEVMFYDLSERLFHEVKQASLNGVTLGEVLQAWGQVGREDEIKIAFQYLAPRLLDNGVFQSVGEMTHSLDKTAGARMVNPKHPVVSEFRDFSEVLSKLAETRATRDVVVEHIEPIELFLKKAAAGGIVPEAWRAYKGVVGDVGRHVGNAVEAVYNNPQAPGAIGEKADKAFQIGAKYVLPALAARHVYKNYVEPNPLYQEATNAILPSTPGTSQFYGYGY